MDHCSGKDMLPRQGVAWFLSFGFSRQAWLIKYNLFLVFRSGGLARKTNRTTEH
ncbi:MAG TPA: hypothetical protein PKA44_04580 [Saprospiraceae bacterium]|jgi:hypothetical protein|nr:hypothetical protein [Saprospiraceae bacterium]